MDGWMDRQTNKSSRSCQLFTIPIFSFFSFILSFLRSFLPRSEQRCPYPASWEGGVRACACVCVCAGAGLAGTMDSTVHPMVRRDGKGAPVYANLK